jgi:hypothetical protein
VQWTELRVTFNYMAPLASPIWLDGFNHFGGFIDDGGLCSPWMFATSYLLPRQHQQVGLPACAGAAYSRGFGLVPAACFQGRRRQHCCSTQRPE